MNLSFKKFLGILGAAFIIGAIGNANTPAVQEQTQRIQPTAVNTVIPTEAPLSTPLPLPTRKPTVTPVPTVYKAPTTPPVQNETGYGDNDTYINSQGDEVQSPGYYNSAPAGASAQCGDGTYSFSQSRRGTCSHHGGVATWL